MEIVNYKLKDFLKQNSLVIDSYSKLLYKYIKPAPIKEEIQNMTFEFVYDLKRAILNKNDSDLFVCISKIQGVKVSRIYNTKIVTLFGWINEVIKQIELINKIEEHMCISTIINKKWEQVNGNDRMGVFMIYNMLDMLADGDATKYDYFKQLIYCEAIIIIGMKTTKSNLHDEMSRIK